MFYNKGKGALFNSTEKENYKGIFTTQKIYIIKGRVQDKKLYDKWTFITFTNQKRQKGNKNAPAVKVNFVFCFQ